MHLIVLFGPPAAGKMTVGLELERLTGLRLFHNHLTIEPVLRYFDFGEPAFNRLVDRFRRGILEEVAASNLPGLIFTYVWALDCAGDKAFVDDVVAMSTSRPNGTGPARTKPCSPPTRNGGSTRTATSSIPTSI